MAFIVSSLLVLSYENFREFLDKMCRCDGMVDVADSKSAGGDSVWVRVPPPAPRRRKRHIACGDFFQKSPRAHFAAAPFRIKAAANDIPSAAAFYTFIFVTIDQQGQTRFCLAENAPILRQAP